MTTTAPARRRDAAHNRDALLCAARTELARDPHASIDTIARAAGLTRRAVYGHFADRDALVQAAVALGAERFNLIAARATATDPAVALATLAVRLWGEAAHVRLSAAVALDDAHLPYTARALSPLRTRLRDLVEEGVRATLFREDLPPALLADLIEQAARTVLRELDETRVDDAPGFVARIVLSIAGLSWREAETLLAAHPEIFEESS